MVSLPFSKEGGAERRKVKCAARRIISCESKESSRANQSILVLRDIVFAQPCVINLSSAPYGVTSFQKEAFDLAHDETVKPTLLAASCPHSFLRES